MVATPLLARDGEGARRTAARLWDLCGPDLCRPNILIRRDSFQTRGEIAPDGTDTNWRRRETFSQSEPAASLDRRLDTENSLPLDACTHSHAPRRAGSEQSSNGCAFGARTTQETEPACRPAHHVNPTDFGGAFESAPKGIRTTGRPTGPGVVRERSIPPQRPFATQSALWYIVCRRRRPGLLPSPRRHRGGSAELGPAIHPPAGQSRFGGFVLGDIGRLGGM